MQLLNSSKKLLVYDGPLHLYTVDDEKYTSITVYIKYFCEPFNRSYEAKREATRREVPEEQVIKEWEGTSSHGIFVHKEIEEYLLRTNAATTPPDASLLHPPDAFASLSPPITPPDYFKTFYEEFKRYFTDFTIIVPEQRLFDPDRKIAGTADFVAVNPQGRAILIDWKTYEKMYTASESGAMCRPPYEHIPDCKLGHCKLQLNYYRSMLERWYGVTIVMMFIVIFNREGVSVYNIERIYVV
jgi:hypothetical protein